MGQMRATVALLCCMVVLVSCTSAATPSTGASVVSTTSGTAADGTTTSLTVPDSAMTTLSNTTAPSAPTTTIPWTPPQVCAGCDPYEVVATVPAVVAGRDTDVAGVGVTYWVGPEPAGPAGFAVETPTLFWIADSYAIDDSGQQDARLLRVEPDAFTVVPLQGDATGWGIDGIALIDEHIAVLRNYLPGKIVSIVDHSGELVESIRLPRQQLDYPMAGLGWLGGPRTTIFGDELLFNAGPDLSSYSIHLDPPSVTKGGGFLTPIAATVACCRTATTARAGYVTIDITADQPLFSYHLVGVNPDGSFVIQVQDVDGATRAIWYQPDGTITGTTIPLHDQYIPVAHPLALGPDGNIYALITHPTETQIIRITYHTP
jgi:hypothetical protein